MAQQTVQMSHGSKVQSKINLFAFGAPFSGKSTLGLSLALLKNPDGSPFKLLVLDAEQGGCDDQLDELEAQGVNRDNILIFYTQSLAVVKHYIRKATEQTPFYELDADGLEDENSPILDGDGKPFIPNAILVDGSSVLKMVSTQSLLELSRRRAKVKASAKGLTGDEKFVATTNAQLELRDYNALNYDAASLVLDLAASGLHWVLTAREKPETIQREINGKVESVQTGKFTYDSYKGIDYNAKTVVRMFRDDEEPDLVKMEVRKDRTHVFDVGIINDPSLLPYQALIDKTANRINFGVKNTMQEAVNAEGKLFQKSLGIEDSSDKSDVYDGNGSNGESFQEDDPVALGKEIVNRRTALSAEKKAAFKKELTENGLPITVKNASIEDLREVMALLKKFEE